VMGGDILICSTGGPAPGWNVEPARLLFFNASQEFWRPVKEYIASMNWE